MEKLESEKIVRSGISLRYMPVGMSTVFSFSLFHTVSSLSPSFLFSKYRTISLISFSHTISLGFYNQTRFCVFLEARWRRVYFIVFLFLHYFSISTSYTLFFSILSRLLHHHHFPFLSSGSSSLIQFTFLKVSYKVIFHLFLPQNVVLFLLSASF